MENRILRKTGYDPENMASDGNRFLCANGYMGMRGTPEEAGPEQFAAVTLAGVYDRNGDRWREPVNAPHGLRVRLRFDGEALDCTRAETEKHETSLDYRYGLYSRDTDFGPVRLVSERFLSMAGVHLMAGRLYFRGNLGYQRPAPVPHAGRGRGNPALQGSNRGKGNCRGDRPVRNGRLQRGGKL